MSGKTPRVNILQLVVIIATPSVPATPIIIRFSSSIFMDMVSCWTDAGIPTFIMSLVISLLYLNFRIAIST